MPELTIRDKIVEIHLRIPFQGASTIIFDRDMLWILKKYSLGHIYRHGKVIAVGVWRRDELDRNISGHAKAACYLNELVYATKAKINVIKRKTIIHKNGDILDNTFLNLAMNSPENLGEAKPHSDIRCHP
jgi:hypothetical protein